MKPTMCRLSYLQPFNCDETSQNFYFLTDKTLATVIEKTAAGSKLSKEWVTLIFALMAVVLTEKSQCPCCFHDIHHKLEYAVPKNAWMTTVSSSMACSSNVINLIQPTDQGNIIQQYKRKLLRKLVIEKEVHVSTQKVLKNSWLQRCRFDCWDMDRGSTYNSVQI